MFWLESIEDAHVAIGEIKSEIERVVSHLEQFEPKLLHDYIPILFPNVAPDAIAWWKSPGGAPAPIGEKWLTWKDESVKYN